MIEPAVFQTVFLNIIPNLLFFGYDKAILEVENLTTLKLEHPNFSLFTRKTLGDSGKKGQNKNELDYWRSNVHLLVQECKDSNITKWATQDQRIDVLRFPPQQIEQLLDLSTARLMTENKKIVEIPLHHYISSKYFSLGFLRGLSKAIHRCKIKKTPVIFINDINSSFDIIGPNEKLGFAHFINYDTDYLYTHSLEQLEKRLLRNKKRLSDEYIAPGITEISGVDN